MLKINLAHAAAKSTVELDGVDISRYLSGVRIEASVGDVTTATLTYSGAVVVVGEPGQFSLVQAPHFVQCSDCQKTVQGEAQDRTVVETTSLADDHRCAAVVAV